MIRRTLLLSITLLVAGCGGGPPPAPPPPTPEPVAGKRAELLEELRAARKAAEQNSEIHSLLAVRASTAVADARRAWFLARDAFRTLVRERGVRRVCEQLSRLPPDPGVLDEVSRFLLLHRLLDRAPQMEDRPLFPPGEGPDLQRVLRVCAAVRRDPRMDGRRTSRKDHHRARRKLYLPELGSSGRTWEAIRRLEDLEMIDSRNVLTSLRLRGFDGTPWSDPSEDVPEFMVETVQEVSDQLKVKAAPEETAVSLRPFEGDLILLVNTWQLQASRHWLADIVGREQTVRLLLSIPRDDVAGPGPPPDVPDGYMVRVRRQCLPEGARLIRIRAVGLEGLAASNPVAHIGEVYQLVAGEVPALLARHDWEPRGSRLLDPTEKGRLTLELAPLLAELKERPNHAPAHRDAGLLLLEYAQFEAAAARLEEADRLRPGSPRVLEGLGTARWNLGRRRAAADAWWACVGVEPTGPCIEQLRRHAPDELAEHARVGEARVFLELARYLREFRRLDEVQAALRSRVRNGSMPLLLTESNWREQLRSLHREGLLARPGGSTRTDGKILSGAGGRVYSSVYGSREQPDGGPPALRAKRGFTVDPSALAVALDTPELAAFEIGVAHLDDEALAKAAARLADQAVRLKDPWARDALLRRIRRSLGALPDDALRPFLPLLSRLAVGDDTWHRLAARDLLAELERQEVPALDRKDLLPLLRAYREGRVGDALLRRTLVHLGEARTPILRKLKKSTSDKGVQATLDWLLGS